MDSEKAAGPKKLMIEGLVDDEDSEEDEDFDAGEGSDDSDSDASDSSDHGLSAEESSEHKDKSIKKKGSDKKDD
jgi:hypothetical protein